MSSIKQLTVAYKSDYKQLKTKLKKTTLTYGTLLTSSYFICKGADSGISAMLGTASSLVYLDLLSNQVDDIEKIKFPTQLLVPVSTALFESLWNSSPLPFDFDYGATLFGFFIYKAALLNILFEVVRDMLLEKED